MKKLVFTLLCSVLSVATAFAQKDRFRRDYGVVAIFNTNTQQWGDWKEGNNTFVFNVNDNKDVTHYKADGSVAYYRNLSNEIKTGFTDDGYKYQIIVVLDEDGARCRLQLFDDPKVGLKLMYNDVMIQFAQSD
jgi:hypothetical protein